MVTVSVTDRGKGFEQVEKRIDASGSVKDILMCATGFASTSSTGRFERKALAEPVAHNRSIYD